MGNSLAKEQSNAQISKHQFEFQCIIGRGGYSNVWRVFHRASKSILAMKEMRKARIIAKKSVHSVLNERKLLSIVKHPFIVNMQYAFQDETHLYLAMDLMAGGDLRHHLSRNGVFSEEQTQFLVACIVTSLEYLHVNNIIHRDIKPENLVFDLRGYLRLTDFGIARELSSHNIKDCSGTPGYMAPEVMLRQPHGVTADYFALGVLTYECMKGTRPYLGRCKQEIRESILARQVALKRADVPPGWSLEAADFVNKLLARKQADRLGTNGPLELKNHAWLKDFPWKTLFEKRLQAPFKPDLFERSDEITHVDESDVLVSNEAYHDLFAGYLFNNSRRSSRPEESTGSSHRS